MLGLRTNILRPAKLTGFRYLSASRIHADDIVDNKKDGLTANISSWDSAAKNSIPSRRPTGNVSAIMRAMLTMDEAQKEEQSAKKLDVDPSFVKKFAPGSTYDPFDFSMTKLRLQQAYRKRLPRKDVFDKAEVNPLSLWTDPKGLSKFISSNGSILPGRFTGTKGKNQRRVAKAIRRARAAGLLSTVHKDISLLPSENR